MALKDIIAKLSPDHEKLFHHDPEGERRPILDRIAKNREAFADPSRKVRGGRWFEIGNNAVVAFSPTRPDGQPIVIGGQSVTFWPSAEFPGILDAFEAAVRAGEIDDQLEGGSPAGASLPARELTARKPRAKRSDERRARFAETIAARKAGRRPTQDA